MPEHEFSATCTFSYKHRKSDSDLARKNTGDRKPEFWHILRNAIGTDFYFLPRFQDKFLSFPEKASMAVVRTISQPVHNVLRKSPNGPVLVEMFRTIIGPK